MRQEGSLRSWNNGNLTAMRSQRRLVTTAPGNAQRRRVEMISLGITMFSIAAILAAASDHVRTGAPIPWWSPGIFAGIGVAAIGQVALRLPGWARTRASQMEAFAETANKILKEHDMRRLNGPNTSVDATSLPTSNTTE
jgi:hypothetical protein